MRLVAAACVLAVAAAIGACGDDDRDPDRDPFATVRSKPGGHGSLERAAPHWERVKVFSRSGEAAGPIEISARAIQWRARWRCRSGKFALTLSPRPAAGRARVGDRCPGGGSASWVSEGRQRLAIRATGHWRVVVEEQVDTPLREPPLRAMRRPGSRIVARGRFSGIERRGRGTTSLYRLHDGRLALRLERFATAGNTDLFVWLSEARRPRTTKQSFQAPHIELGPLKSTLGDQNYVLPAGVDVDRIRSVVIWCEPVQIAYAAAPLQR